MYYTAKRIFGLALALAGILSTVILLFTHSRFVRFMLTALYVVSGAAMALGQDSKSVTEVSFDD